MHGVAIVDKPAGVTSHDVVGMLRRRLGERRIGHAGTLDPSATGVLVVGIGSVTRLLRFVGEGAKRYTGEVVLGVETDTLDADGTVVATHDMAGVTVEDARAAVAEHLTGDIEQVPPMVSAIRVEGRRLHDLARQGIEVERAPRPVTVHRFDVERHIRSGGAGDRRRVLRRARTCARSPPTSATCSAAVPTCATCGGSPSARSRSTRPARRMTCDVLPPLEALRGMAQGRGRCGDAQRRSPTVGCSMRRRARGRGRWSAPDERLLAVYEPIGGGRAKPAVVLAPG